MLSSSLLLNYVAIILIHLASISYSYVLPDTSIYYDNAYFLDVFVKFLDVSYIIVEGKAVMLTPLIIYAYSSNVSNSGKKSSSIRL